MHDSCVSLHVAQLFFYLLKAFLGHEIRFVEQQDVSIDHLSPTDLRVQQVIVEVLGVDQRNDRVEACGVTQFTGTEGHRHRQRVSQSSGFNHDVIHFIWPLENPLDGVFELIIN